MTQASLSDLVRRVASAEPEALPRWMAGNDRYAGRLDESEISRLAAAALADGEEAAKALPVDKSPEALASELGISVEYSDGEIDVAGLLFSADYRPNPPRIRLYTRALAAIDRGLAAPGVAEIVGTTSAQPVLLAHEIYHHLDLTRAATLTQSNRVTTFRLGPLHLKTELPALAEIAAGRFAATLLGLHCHPKLLDLLLLWDSDPQRARNWAAAFCAFAKSRRPTKETAMTKVLSPAEVAQYRRDGFFHPIRIMSEADAAGYEQRLRAIEAREGGTMSRKTNMKPHLLVPWLEGLVRHPKVLDAVEDVIGPNILAWGSGFFTKGAHDPSFVSWHQDSTYWGLSEPDVITAWIAFTPSTVESGCMRVIPGTHGDQVAHSDTFDERNLLSRGQEIQVKVDESKAADIVLAPGEISLHHVRIIHGSPPNAADHRRIGYAVRYIPTHVRQLNAVRDSAMLVRGVDTYNYFDVDPSPKSEFDPAAVAYHTDLVDRQTRILYAGAEKVRDLDAPAMRAS